PGPTDSTVRRCRFVSLSGRIPGTATSSRAGTYLSVYARPTMRRSGLVAASPRMKVLRKPLSRSCAVRVAAETLASFASASELSGATLDTRRTLPRRPQLLRDCVRGATSGRERALERRRLAMVATHEAAGTQPDTSVRRLEGRRAHGGQRSLDPVGS